MLKGQIKYESGPHEVKVGDRHMRGSWKGVKSKLQRTFDIMKYNPMTAET